LSLDLLSTEFGCGIVEIENNGTLVKFLKEEIVTFDDGDLCEFENMLVSSRSKSH